MKKILIFTLILLLLFVLSIIVRVFLNSSPLVDKFFIITITTGLICLFFYTTFFIFKKIFHKVYPLFKIVDNYLFRKVKIVTILLILISIILIIVSILSKKSQDIFELIIGLLVTGPLILIFYNVSKSNKLEKITKKLLLIMTLYPLIMYFYFVIQLFSDNPDELSPGQAFVLGLPFVFKYIIFIGIIYFFSRILYFIFQNKKPKINNDRIPTTKE